MRLFGSLLVLALLLCGSSGEYENETSKTRKAYLSISPLPLSRVVIEHDMDGSMALKPSGARVEVEKGVVECDAVQLPKPTSNPTGGASDATISITGEDLKYLRDTYVLRSLSFPCGVSLCGLFFALVVLTH